MRIIITYVFKLSVLIVQNYIKTSSLLFEVLCLHTKKRDLNHFRRHKKDLIFRMSCLNFCRGILPIGVKLSVAN